MNPTTALVIGIVATIAIGIIAWLLVVALDLRRRPRVIVPLRDGSALRGVLTQRGPRQLRLDDVEVFGTDPNADPVRVDGAVFVDRRSIRWIQDPEA